MRIRRFEKGLKELKEIKQQKALFTRFLEQYSAKLNKSKRKKKKREKSKKKRKSEGLSGLLTPLLIAGAGISIVALIRHFRSATDSIDAIPGDTNTGPDYTQSSVQASQFENLVIKGGVLFSHGGVNLDPSLIGLLQLFNKHKIPARVTSAVRDPSMGVGNMYANSPHNSGRAIDITPQNTGSPAAFANLRESIRNTPEIVQYMRSNGLNILDETRGSMQMRTGATGSHFHIEKSRNATVHMKESTEKFWRGETGDNPALFGRGGQIVVPAYPETAPTATQKRNNSVEILPKREETPQTEKKGEDIIVTGSLPEVQGEASEKGKEDVNISFKGEGKKKGARTESTETDISLTRASASASKAATEEEPVTLIIQLPGGEEKQVTPYTYTPQSSSEKQVTPYTYTPQSSPEQVTPYTYTPQSSPEQVTPAPSAYQFDFPKSESRRKIPPIEIREGSGAAPMSKGVHETTNIALYDHRSSHNIT